MKKCSVENACVNQLHFIHWAGHSVSYKIACALSKDSDQPAHTLRLIKVFAVRQKTRWMLGYHRMPCEVWLDLWYVGMAPEGLQILQAFVSNRRGEEVYDEPVRLRRLIWAFAVHICSHPCFTRRGPYNFPTAQLLKKKKKKKKKRVREKSRECHNHKPQLFPDTKRKPTNSNKHKSNKRMKSTKISSLFPKRGNGNAKMTEKHKNRMTQGKS